MVIGKICVLKIVPRSMGKAVHIYEYPLNLRMLKEGIQTAIHLFFKAEIGRLP